MFCAREFTACAGAIVKLLSQSVAGRVKYLSLSVAGPTSGVMQQLTYNQPGFVLIETEDKRH